MNEISISTDDLSKAIVQIISATLLDVYGLNMPASELPYLKELMNLAITEQDLIKKSIEDFNSKVITS